ncbi:MAG TPA: replicative DNA helicase [Propionibacteriaceae bacterium]|nr:replicative DNA helicase [Propionibacteriaceae bacterium]
MDAPSIDRTPPQDVQAEQSVLGAMMTSKDAIANVVEVVKGRDFYRPAHELIYDAITDLYGKGEPADAITVAAELTKRGEIARCGGHVYIHDLLASVAIAANASYYAEIVKEKAILRRLVEASIKIAQMGYQATGEVSSIVDHAQQIVYEVTDGKTSEDYRPLSELIEPTWNELEAIASRGGRLAGIPTGFAELDELTNGLHAGQMIIIAARPAIGKSTLALDIARSAAIKNHLTTAIFSLEMSANEIMMRLLSAESGMRLHKMRNGQINDDDWERLAKTTGKLQAAPLFIDDSPNLTMMEIRAKARRLKQRHDLKMVVIDYMQLMTSGKKVENRQVEVSEFSRSIKLLAKELEVPVIAISQLNRGSEQRGDKKPLLSDLRESGCLTAGTRILRADTGAEVSFGELMATGATEVPVWSVDDSGRMVARPMTHAFSSGRKETFRLRLASGREVEATANHPFLTYDGWLPLGELAVGTRLAIPRQVPEPLEPLDADVDEIVLLAHLLGGGSLVKRQPIRYASIDEANRSAVIEAAERRFGIHAIRDEYPAARVTTLRLPATYHLTHGKRNPIAAWLDDQGLLGLRSHEKFVPSWVFSLPRVGVGLFLKHLWATDGSVGWDAKKRQGHIYYASTSRRLADDVMRLLSRYGIVARLKTVSKQGYRDSFHVTVDGVDQQRTFCHYIGVHGARGEKAVDLERQLTEVKANTNLDTVPVEVWTKVKRELVNVGMTHPDFAAEMGTSFSGSTMGKHAPSRPRLARIAAALQSADLEAEATNDIYWDRVVGIEPLGTQDVYDATVIGSHNFVANGIAVHNSLEQDADMVILLHREEAYNKDERPGEADFIVAKHRNGETKTIVAAFQGHYSRFVDMQYA